MTITQLEYIVAVDTYRSFSTAAEKCFITQPTLSMQIQKLEDTLGVKIFDRSKQPVIPTEIGAEIIAQARVLLGEGEKIRELITSTASKRPLFTEEMVRKAMVERNNEPLFFIDLSVPRNVDVAVSEIENVHVYDIDALHDVIEDNLDRRKGEITHAELIIEESVAEFSQWHAIQVLVPTFQNISSRFQEINKTMLDGYLKNQKQDDHEKAVAYGEIITKKFIGLMIENVKSVTNNGRHEEYITMLNKLFEFN